MSNKLNLKSFLVGIVLSGLIFGSIIPISAAVQNVTAKLGNVNCKIDGQTTSLNSINYNNKNYVQLRDIVTKMGGNIAVNNTDNTIVINSNQNEPVGDSVSTNTATMTVQDTPTTTDSNSMPILTYQHDNINNINYCTYNDIKYIVFGDFNDYIFKYGLDTTDVAGYNPNITETQDGLCLVDKKKSIILKNIPHIFIGLTIYISYDYFTDTVLHAIK